MIPHPVNPAVPQLLLRLRGQQLAPAESLLCSGQPGNQVPPREERAKVQTSADLRCQTGLAAVVGSAKGPGSPFWGQEVAKPRIRLRNAQRSC